MVKGSRLEEKENEATELAKEETKDVTKEVD